MSLVGRLGKKDLETWALVTEGHGTSGASWLVMVGGTAISDTRAVAQPAVRENRHLLAR